MWPIWLLDIDGVINADPFQVPTHVWPEDRWLIRMVDDSKGRSWKITAAQPVLNFILRVHEEKRAEIRWLTTWQQDANNVSDALSLPRFPVLTNPMVDGTRYHDSRTWWKYHEATKISVSGRPVIWTDDDLSRQIKDAYRHITVNHLLIAPASAEGLASKHLIRIAAFLNMPYDPE